MGYRPNQIPSPPADPWRPPTPRNNAAANVAVALALTTSTVLYMLGLVPFSVPLSIVIGFVGWNVGARLAPSARELPDPRATARELTRARIRAELDADRERAAWLAKTIGLELENGIAPDPDYEREIVALTARMKARDAELDALAQQEASERAAAPAKPRQAPYPPRGRGASSHEPLGEDVRSIFGFPVDHAARVVVVKPASLDKVQQWIDRRGFDLTATTEHPLFTGLAGRPCRVCGLPPHRYEGTHRYDDGVSTFDDSGRRLPDPELVRRLTSAEPVRILGPGAVVRQLHACSTVDCNGIDSPHCHMSQPCTCMAPGRGWSTCPQHPEISPL